MKHILPFAAAVTLLPLAAQAQNVGVGTATPNAKAALEISANDRGLLIPRLTQAQRLAITSPPQGLLVYQTDGTASGGTQTGFWYYAGTPATWVFLSPAGDNLGNHVATQTLALADNALHLRTATDANHRLIYDSSTDGPVLAGFAGGLLGTRSGTTTTGVLGWKSTGRVGIGSAAGNPVVTFHVGGTAGTNNVRLESLGGTGSRMVVADASGNLSTQSIPGASNDWSLTGNATDGNQFIGTTNDQDFFVKRNNTEAFRVYSNGRVSLGNNTSGSASVMLGFNAGVAASQTGAQYNTFVGARTGEANNGYSNTLIGYAAGQSSTGGGNTLMGYSAGGRMLGGENNVFIGNLAGYGSSNTAIGNSNIVIGTSAAPSLNSNSSNNILIGGSASASAGLYDAYAIGNNATVTQANSLVFGTAPGSNDAVSVGIGTSAPSSSLQVNGTFAVGVQNNYGGGVNIGNANNLDQGRSSITGGYYGLAANSGNQWYKLPDPTTCPGRIYYLRNNNSTNSAFLTTTGGSIYGASSTGAVSSTSGYEMKATTTSKTVIAISDGTNWTVGTLN